MNPNYYGHGNFFRWRSLAAGTVGACPPPTSAFVRGVTIGHWPPPLDRALHSPGGPGSIVEQPLDKVGRAWGPPQVEDLPQPCGK